MKPNSLTVEIHQDLTRLRDEWRVFQEFAAGGPHDTWEWNQAWLRTAGRGSTPLIAVGRDGAGEIVMLLPLTIRARAGCKVLEWLGAEQGNYSSGLFHPAAWRKDALPRGEDLVKLVLAALPPVDAVHLSHLPQTTGRLDAPLAGLPGVRMASPGYGFPLTSDWQSHFNERFSSRQRSKLRNAERQLANKGAVRFQSESAGPKSARIIDGMIAEKRLWLAQRGIGDFLVQEGMRDFFHAILTPGDSKMEPGPRLFTLRVDGEVAATNLGLVYQNRFYGLMASTTEGPLRRHTPGRLLFLKLVEQLAREGIEMIDCGAGEDEDKLRWCTQQRERLHALVPVTLAGQAYVQTMKAMLGAKGHIKRTPGLWTLAKRARRWKALLVPTRAARQINASASTAHSLEA